MRNKSLQTAVISLFSVLFGCTQDDLVRMANKETFSFEGTYDNQYTPYILVFKEGKVSFQAEATHFEWERNYTVKDNLLYIQIRNSSLEKRDDLVMRIHGGGEVLTCTACAQYQLSNIWVRLDALPQNAALK
ncbi:hypothetical protein EXA23_03660 [Vibrio cincinnatiensis]|jgi:hypothetical protein|uniref:Lipoprotein n=1 Tax=Vibrio cincinnatiensis DSM 19608 TaxID=1123491 RepID=A0A1T4NR34_VIBCI|nr:hypothetical protein [Vibrio cincinnatiensis]MCG3720943.1 hypothetical protein [Vibrio cincinnatiensis]MCG3732839.1 hypothetical protein [Vibrio cincinnatiensis]MCG3735649.1 hypothetical protein [Vibrio cincinnatiensis]MCG3739064.1 hypothetical protein [Vibrio cincinnatiensis]MCG3741880.1 hypothetical protein [Vibrio cincinnatiensis]